MANQDLLVRRVLSELGLQQAGQTPSAEDVAAVVEIIPAALDDLAMRQVVYVADPDDFPDGYLKWLAMFIAQYAAEDFGANTDGDKMMAAEKRLRELQIERTDNERPNRALYF